MTLRSRHIALALLIAVLPALPARGQTCSCAGAPLISTQSTGATSAGNLVVGLTTEHNEISSIYAGQDQLEDESVARATQSVLLEVNYGLTDRLSIASTLTFVRKERTTGLGAAGAPTTVTTRGLGDGLLMLRYTLAQQSLWNRYHLALGAGGKLPLGAASLTREGHPLNADMQPGTGAWDGVLWSYAAVSLLPHATLDLFTVTSYRRTSGHERFGEDDEYRFGNELTTVLGATDGLTAHVSYALQLRYRSTTSDRLNGTPLPNTGGKWLSIAPALNVAAGDLFSVRLSGRYPVWQSLSGSQPTTTYAASLSLFLNLNGDDDGFRPGDPR